MIDDVEKMLRSAATEIFSTMLNIQVQLEASDALTTDGSPHIAGAVGFTGKFNGVVYLYSGVKFARAMTCNLLGLSEDQIEGDEMVNDAMGELTNMLAGHIKSRMCDRGASCAITIPSVVRGRDFRIEPISGAERRAIWAICPRDRVRIEIIMKPEDQKK
jgi:chemotaxis protein CheX